MKLKTLLEGISVNTVIGDIEKEIRGICTDSRLASSGDLFVALRGEHADGRDYAARAVGRGAAAVLYENGVRICEDESATCVSVEDARVALARLANNFYKTPSEDLSIVGVTGTNGKTTITYILRSIIEAAGKGVGLIGTIGYVIGSESTEAPFTTPEAPEFQALLRRMLDKGATHVVAEVSSHALALRRVDGTRFSVAVFTNLTQDHLDFHSDMEHYFASKRRLFDELLKPGGAAVINVDDDYGRQIAATLKKGVITYSINSEADLRATGIETGMGGVSFSVSHKGKTHKISSPLMGTPNVYNILGAIGAALALGIGWDEIADGVTGLRQVAGRFEAVDMGQDFVLLIDYAHTDDALARLVTSAREITAGKVITVFGCGGERDRGKRPKMGKAATELSDRVFITSDNPRGEDPASIIDDIVKGITEDNYSIIPDRAQAIFDAVGEATTGDTVLIAGKGHEDYQLLGDKKVHFSDREVAEKALKSRRGGR